MMLPKSDFNWGNLWADLLKGAGRGLLVHDGSRLSEAALAGLEVFDAAQERRRRHEAETSSGQAYQDELPELLATMVPEERAAFLRLPLAEREAWMEEWKGGPTDDTPSAGDATRRSGSPSHRLSGSCCHARSGPCPRIRSTAGACNRFRYLGRMAR